MRTRVQSAGFTLLEVLVAIAIIVLLTAALFSFYEYSLTVRDRTQEASVEAQLARVVLDRMATEMESVSAVTTFVRMRSVRRGFSVSGGNEGVSPDGGMTGSTSRVAYLSSRNIPPGRFIDPSVLDKEGGSGQRPPLYDVFEVNWFWVDGSGLYRSSRPFVERRISQADLSDMSVTGGDDGAADEVSPWERLLAQRMGTAAPDGTATDPAAEENADPLRVTEKICPEVQWIYLRYYVNGTWQTDFASGPTPQAVEITVGFAPLLTQEEIDAGETTSGRLAELFDDSKAASDREPLPAHSYQRVVLIPSGEMFGGSGVRQQSRN
ncbi:MAG: hypothetical protein BIFFINMI_01127 [Phycisphaerae bacterium]|nr:hypothetical protein [Phycisphaerae bacterium]